jgi:uncharacterized membrane protein YkgB
MRKDIWVTNSQLDQIGVLMYILMFSSKILGIMNTISRLSVIIGLIMPKTDLLGNKKTDFVTSTKAVQQSPQRIITLILLRSEC